MSSDLSLTEGATQTPPVEWKETSPGQSCSEYCSANEQACDDTVLKTSITDSETLYTQVSDYQVCALPLLSGCGDRAGGYDAVNQFCYYPDSTCAAQNRTPAIVSCSSKSEGLSKFCVCADSENSHASTRGVGSLVAFLLLPLLFAANPRLTIVLLVLVGLAYSHNWVNSNSRSKGASAVLPCKPVRTDLPHAQVGPGQAFQIEWMNGHGGFTYFAILHSKYADRMNIHTFTLLEDYIAEAPAGSNKALEPAYQRLHRRDIESLDNEFKSGTVKNYFASFINKTDPLYIPRPASFGGKVGLIEEPDESSPIYLVSYKPETLSEDVLVSYHNPKYYWLEAVYRYKIVVIQAARPDTANFHIPGYAGSGKYIVHYMWRGYRDCVDIDFKDTTVENVYGYPLEQPRWQRIDHCLFEDARLVFDSSKIVTDPQYCMDQCTNGRCLGVNVVPLKAPAAVYQGFGAPPGDTWLFPEIYGTDVYVPWAAPELNASIFLNDDPTSEKYICYNVQPAQNTDTTDEYTTTADPADPVFYSTCYYKSTKVQTYDDYVDTENTAKMPVDWRFVDKCIDCASQSTLTEQSVLPKWNIAETCVNCDLEPVNATEALPFAAPVLVEDGTFCDGFGGNWAKAAHYSCEDPHQCYKQLIVPGRNVDSDTSPEECQVLASEDSECSNTIVMRGKAPRTCFCYKKDSCCKTCTRNGATAYGTYELVSTPDPTCATGVKSADNAFCCSASCGGCAATGYLNYVGFCCSTCITRSCSEYGPPCTLAV
jgi:hypothetical protein